MAPSSKAGRSGRRGGVARSLNTEQIVDAALAITREANLSGLTMNVLAERLGVGAMTLYSYFRSRDELLDAMGRQAAVELYEWQVDATDAPWQEGLRVHYQSIREGLKSRPALADLIFFRGELIPADAEHYAPIVAHMRRHIDAMVDGGVPAELAMRVFLGLSMFTVASVLREDDYTTASTLYRRHFDDLVESVTGETDHDSDADARFGSDTEFTMMLDIFIEGIESTVKKRKRQRTLR
ncbi:TetR/AcrR family transcriptional regulator [Nocardia gamkensis]|uniref:TetR/AcrR family transcriptional regulator n=1 Tax=Nocardia gamkensis TaxID=352869 RepID=UPI0036E36E10